MEIKYDNIVKDVLVSHDEIVEISKRLGKQISEDYKDKNLVIIGMLVGGMPFMMELIKYITIPVELDFIQAKSYEGTCSTNIVTFKPIVPETVAPAQEESQGNMVQLFQKIELLESKLDAFIAENKMTGMTSGVMKKEVNASGF